MRVPFHQKMAAGLLHPRLAVRRLRGKDPVDIDLSEISRFMGSGTPVVVEAGAYDGVDTERFAREWPQGQVFAFEPVPSLFADVRNRVGSLKNVTLYQLALVGDPTVSSVELHVGGGGGGNASSSILAPTEVLEVFPEVDLSGSIVAPATTLDAWAEREGVEDVDLLWLDLQGAELMVLGQGERLLGRVQVAHLEVTTRPLYEGAATWSDVRAFMLSRGFREAIARVPLLTGNVLYVRN